MTNHDATSQPVTFYTNDLTNIFVVLGALRPIIAREQGAWPQDLRDAINKAYRLVTFEADGGCHYTPGAQFYCVALPTLTTEEKGN